MTLPPTARLGAGFAMSMEVAIGLGRIVALHDRSSALYQIWSEMRGLYI
jgi:hypothetical protein